MSDSGQNQSQSKEADSGSVNRQTLLFALSTLVAALLILFVWIPNDSASGIVEKVRGRHRIGDALAPSLAASVILCGAILLLFETRGAREFQALTTRHFGFLFRLLLILGIALIVMRWAGPVAVLVFHESGTSEGYRLLRATSPWHYIGFVTGGLLLIAGLHTLVTGRFNWKSVVVALLVVGVMVVAVDWLFDDLLLPPNGDV